MRNNKTDECEAHKRFVNRLSPSKTRMNYSPKKIKSNQDDKESLFVNKMNIKEK